MAVQWAISIPIDAFEIVNFFKMTSEICIVCKQNDDDVYRFGEKITIEDVTAHHFCLVRSVFGRILHKCRLSSDQTITLHHRESVAVHFKCKFLCDLYLIGIVVNAISIPIYRVTEYSIDLFQLCSALLEHNQHVTSLWTIELSIRTCQYTSMICNGHSLRLSKYTINSVAVNLILFHKSRMIKVVGIFNDTKS